MEEDETPRGGYKEALLSAAGKRERSKAHTGLTPPAKVTLGRKEDSMHRQEKVFKGPTGNNAARGPLDGGGDSPTVERG